MKPLIFKKKYFTELPGSNKDLPKHCSELPPAVNTDHIIFVDCEFAPKLWPYMKTLYPDSIFIMNRKGFDPLDHLSSLR